MSRDAIGAAAGSLLPFSLLYWAAASARNLLYDLGVFRSFRASIPVVSVGNLTAGGTGKTPFAVMLASALADRGKRPAVLSRGYGRRKGAPEPLTVSDGRAIGCSVDESGDEPMLMARKLADKGIPVIVGADRLASASRAAEMGADLAILDDGFQHRRLRRDFDIVLLDQRKPFGNGLPLPAGRLRESPRSLRRADTVVMTRAEGEDAPRQVVRHLRRGAPVFISRHVPASLVEIGDWRRGAVGLAAGEIHDEVLLFSGVAVPGSFRLSAESLGLRVARHLRFPDHQRYGEPELRRIEEAGAKYRTAVTTEKDAVRLPLGWTPGFRLLVLGVEIRLEPEGSSSKLADIIISKLSSR